MVLVSSQLTSAGDDDSSYTYSYDAAGYLTQVDNSGTSDIARCRARFHL